MHDYLSTACFHGLHDRCRLQCKFCSVQCKCPCHERDAEEIERLRAELAASMTVRAGLEHRLAGLPEDKLRALNLKQEEEIARLKSIVERSIRLLNDARSGHISGSQSDTDWDMQRGRLVVDARAELAARASITHGGMSEATVAALVRERDAALARAEKAEVLVASGKKVEEIAETDLLLSSPENAERLRSALARAEAGKLVEHELDECSGQAPEQMSRLRDA